MAKRHPAARLTGLAAMLGALCVLSGLSARGQNDPKTALPVSLDARTASKLLQKFDPPEYPPLAKVNYIQGAVQLRIRVSPEGRVVKAHVIIGHPFLATAALNAIWNWAYRPYRVGKRAVEFSTVVEVRFKLLPKELEAMPPTAAQDLSARVTPPTVAGQGASPASGDHVRLRVLLDSQGRPLDTEVLSGKASDVHEAENEILHWTFRPARWGALAVPWYIEVDVPVPHAPA